MPERSMPMLDGPIPGQSLTSEPGARPWEQPAKYPTVEKTIAFYLEDLSQPRKMAHMLDKIEEGAPLALIADTLQTLGVSKGLHSLDVGILISPVLIEFMKAASEQEGIEYRIGTEDDDIADQEDQEMAKMVAKELYSEEEPTEVTEEEAPSLEIQEETSPRTGLMAPKRKNEEVIEDGV